MIEAIEGHLIEFHFANIYIVSLSLQSPGYLFSINLIKWRRKRLLEFPSIFPTYQITRICFVDFWTDKTNSELFLILRNVKIVIAQR